MITPGAHAVSSDGKDLPLFAKVAQADRFQAGPAISVAVFVVAAIAAFYSGA